MLAFVLLVSWRQPAWRVVVFCAGVGGLTLVCSIPLLCRITESVESLLGPQRLIDGLN